VRSTHEARARRVWRWSLAVSILLHVLVLVVSPLFLRIGTPPGEGEQVADASDFSGMRMIDPALLPDYTPALPPATAPATPDVAGADAPATPTQPEAWRVAPRTGGAAARPEASPTPREGGTGAADNPLRPGLRDPRLWVAPREVEKMEPSQAELHAEYMANLEARLRAWNDSVGHEADRQRRATDWTVRDKNGGRWGVSPDGIHLGGVTLPPATFPPGGGDPDKRARAEQQERDRRDIDRQQADTDRRRQQAEAIRATRERRDAERNNNRNNQ
jgi:hypothetical protein